MECIHSRAKGCPFETLKSRLYESNSSQWRTLASSTQEAAMSTQLDPRVSEFETQEQADSYDRWFRQRIERSLADPRPAIPHDEAMARVRAVIEAKRRRAG